MSDEKTEKPTPKKLQDAKKEGQHAKSADIPTSLVLGGGIAALSATSGWIALKTRELIEIAFNGGFRDGADDVSLLLKMSAMGATAMKLCLPLAVLSVLLGLIGIVAQVGFNISFKPLGPNFDKLNPGTNLKNLISVKSLIELVKLIVKAVAMVAIVYSVMKDLLPLMVGASYLSPAGIAAIGWAAAVKVVCAALILFVILGPVDYGLQRWQFIRGQRMSKDDIKREHKESEGDPKLKSQRKQLAREMVNSSPKESVAGATVVVTNPTHYAVALRYQSGETPLPVVVAKGVDESAAMIRRYAEEAGVPIVGDPPLARALYKLPIDQHISEELIEAVVAVIGWVNLVKQIEASHAAGQPARRPSPPSSRLPS